jgi:hypothetical protein
MTLPVYRGATVWTTEPNAITDPKVGFRRSLQTLDPGTGRLTVVDRSGVTTLDADTIPYLFERSDVLNFRTFLSQCKGQLVPFWLPTWQADFRLYAPAYTGASTLEIQNCGYSRFAFANPARRDIVVMLLDRSAMYFHRITAAVWAGGSFETLTLETPLEANITDAAVLISFLTYVRLASDDQGECVWQTTEAATAQLAVASLPQEVPA